MSVGDNVAYGLKVKKVGADERRRRVARRSAWSAWTATRTAGRPAVGRPAPAWRSPARSSTARVLLLDEPLGALDLKLRQQVRHELRSSRRCASPSSTTHDQEEALTMSDRLAVFNDGRIEQVGAPAEVYEHPVNEFVAGFVGVSNIVERDGERFTIRPEKVHPGRGDSPRTGCAWRRAGRDVATSGGPRYIVDLDGGGEIQVVGRTSRCPRRRRSSSREAGARRVARRARVRDPRLAGTTRGGT